MAKRFWLTVLDLHAFNCQLQENAYFLQMPSLLCIIMTEAVVQRFCYCKFQTIKSQTNVVLTFYQVGNLNPIYQDLVTFLFQLTFMTYIY